VSIHLCVPKHSRESLAAFCTFEARLVPTRLLGYDLLHLEDLLAARPAIGRDLHWFLGERQQYNTIYIYNVAKEKNTT